MQNDWDSHIWLVEAYILVQPLWKIVNVSYPVLTHTRWPRNPLLDIDLAESHHVSTKEMYYNSHSSTIHNFQKNRNDLCLAILQWMHNLSTLIQWNTIYKKNVQATAIFNNTDKSVTQTIIWKMQHTKDYILYYSIYVTYKFRQN